MKNFTLKLACFAVLTVLVLPAIAAAADCNENFCPLGPGDKVWLPFLTQGSGLTGAPTFGRLMVIVLNFALLIAGSVATLFLIIGAFRYLTSSGNEEAAEAAKKMMTNAVVGLIIIIMSFAMIYIITRALLTGSPAA